MIWSSLRFVSYDGPVTTTLSPRNESSISLYVGTSEPILECPELASLELLVRFGFIDGDEGEAAPGAGLEYLSMVVGRDCTRQVIRVL